jgi:DNA-binding SARP family transcriptional activator/tetratricopeptide (TPR) repeat protein
VTEEKDQAVHVTLLGPFSVTSGGRTAGPWPRPSARRLCELVLVSPGRRVSRDLVCEELFPGLDPRAAARSVSKALSMARVALSGLGPHADALLMADLTQIWVSPAAQVDAEAQQTALRAALSMPAGQDRDDRFVAALAEEAELLADEPYADWALRPRERLEALRQEARLTLARDRAKGAGRSRPEALVQAWESCFEHDPASEEAAGALIRAYFGQGRRELAVRSYERCRAALEELGLGLSPSLEEVYATAAFQTTASPAPAPTAMREELRTVSVLSAAVAAPAGLARKLGLEGLRDVVAGSLAAVIAEVEELGGTVTSVSGGGLQAIFGAPEAHEDDPERAVRAAFRAMTAVAGDQAPTLRIGVETGQALLGPIGGGTRVEYGAVGEVVAAAAALQSSARPGSALVGPVTRAATSHLFTWGPSERVQGTEPLVASYLGHPRATTTGRRLRSRIPLAGRQPELAALGAALRAAVAGHGSLVVLTGEPGLGKTRLVQESRKRFMAQAGSANGSLPRWLEGRCASYASATPYGLYRQLVAGWAGVAADQPETVLHPALERALVAATGTADLLPLLARMMGLPPGAALGRMSPEELKRATFTAWYSLISRLVTAGPTVLVLEDLHWADPTSVHLTLHLARLAADRPLLILATTRPDQGSDLARDDLDRDDLARDALARDALARAGCPVHRILLQPLPRDAERELAQSLIGEAASAEVLDTVLSGVEGNPLFLEERLSSLLEAGGLVHERGGWQVGAEADPGVPQVLERLVHARVDRLSPAARDAVRAASVLGAEFSLSLLTAVCAAEAPLEPAVAELCAADLVRPVASRPDPAFRFRHALLQEATYSGLLQAERRLLHGRAAWALEAASQGRLEEAAAVLGRHFAAAGEGERAREYLELAGDHATAVFANDEALSMFRAALAVLDEQHAGRQTAAAGLYAKLANVLWRTARRAEAKEAFQQALQSTKDALYRAHLLTRLGRLEMIDGHDAAATESFDAAEALLGMKHMDDAAVEAWLELMVDGRAGLHTMRNEPDLALATLRVAEPVLEARGTPARRYGFYQVVALGRVLQNRYRVDELDLANMRKAVTAAAQGDDEKDVGYATFFLGRLLLLRGDLAAAGEQLEKSLALAERIGESLLLGQSLLALTVTALRRGDVAAVRSLAPRAMAAATAMASAGAQTGVKACLAWLAWHDQRLEDVVTLVKEITEQQVAVGSLAVFYAWAYLWPLVAVHLEAGDIGEAVAASRQLLDPEQQRPPDELESVLQAAHRAWDRGHRQVASEKLTAALALARSLRYF